MAGHSFRLSVPATSANLGPGFDTLGLALDLRMEVKANPATSWSVVPRGEGADILPTDASNLIVQAARHGLPAGFEQAYQLEIDNPIPVSRGLGSSATAIVTGLALAQLIMNGTVGRDRLFQDAAAYERHPDNVAPAIYGGLCICGQNEDGGYHQRKGDIHPDLKVLIVIPATSASTEKMRGLLPETYPAEVLAANKADCEALLQGIASGGADQLRLSEDDRLHQPYRLPAQPVSHKVFHMLQQHEGICGAFLSGSGATVAGWVMNSDPRADIVAQLASENIDAATHLLNPDLQGFLWEEITVGS